MGWGGVGYQWGGVGYQWGTSKVPVGWDQHMVGRIYPSHHKLYHEVDAKPGPMGATQVELGPGFASTS